MNKYRLAASISSVIVILDFLTKRLIVAYVSPFEGIKILPFLQIVYVENSGAAFGIFRSMGTSFFVVISFVAISVIIIYLSKLGKGLEFYAMSFVLGGAAGNLIDRLRTGKVVDFIDVFVGKWHWPAFNIADSALTIGMILFIWSNFRASRTIKEN